MKATRFILVDDDPVNNLLTKIAVSKVFPGAEVICFQFPEEGLKFISTEYRHLTDTVPAATLFLDINMPVLSGWDFIDEFIKLDEHVPPKFSIYIVSSSIDPDDLRRAKEHPMVKDYIPKPLTLDALKGLRA